MTPVQLQVLKLIQLSPEAYTGIVEKQGYDYAWHYTDHNEAAVKCLSLTASYWKWWLRQWEIRDEVFVAEFESYKGMNEQQLLLELYLDHHSPQSIISRPSKSVLDDALDVMKSQLYSITQK
jgi:hypothetical protein